MTLVLYSLYEKLTIGQASIEYVRYLEDCVAKLKARQSTDLDLGQDDSGAPPGYTDEPFHREHTSWDQEEEEEDTPPDVEMEGSEIPSPALTATHARSQQPSVSPVLLPQGSQSRHNSYSSASTEYRQYEYTVSASTSPAFGPQAYHYTHSVHSASGSTLTSPPLAPQRDMDQEATAALLMLNQSDRRGTGRGMRVRDLLST